MPIQISGVQMGVITGGPSSLTIEDLADVSVVAPATGQYLRYNSGISEWQNAYIDSDVYDYLDGAMSGSNGVSITYTPGPNTIGIALSLTASGDATGSVSSGNLPLTLATVNLSPQTDQFRKITVNGKGLVTETSAVSSSDITTALGFTPVDVAGDTMTGDLILNADPSIALGAATKQYVDNVASGMNVHLACVAATTANLASTYNNGTGGVGATLTANPSVVLPTIDGVSLSVNDRVLVKDQTSQPQNGIYVVTQTSAPWILTRASDFDNSPDGEVVAGDTTFIQQGTTQATTQWVQITTGTITVGTTNIVFTQFGGPGTYTGGTGINIAGTVINNTGVTSIAGTAGNITASAATGAVTLNLATVSDSGSGTFLKLTRDTFGRVSGTTAVVAGDITGLVNSTYVLKAGDTMTGSLTAPSFIPNSSTVPSNGLYLPATNTLGFSTNSSECVRIANTGNVLIGGTTDNGYKLEVTGTTNISGTLTNGSQFLANASDTVSAPGFSWSGDTNTGIYHPATNTIAWTTNGTEAMRLTSASQLLIGSTSAISTRISATSVTPTIQTPGTTLSTNAILQAYYSNNVTGAYHCFAKSRTSTIGSQVSVASGDQLGAITWAGSDGTNFTEGARIQVFVDGTPSTDVMYGRIQLMTTNGGTGPTNRMNINSDGSIEMLAGIASTSTTTGTLQVIGGAGITGAVNAASFNATSTKRVKKAIKNIAKSTVDKFSQLKPREYDRKDYKAHEFGFIAEEMALVYPEVVGRDPDGKPSGIDYGKLSTILTAKVQEQQKIIDKLQDQMSKVLELLKGSR